MESSCNQTCIYNNNILSKYKYSDKIVNIDDFNEFVKQHGFSGCFLSVIPSQDDYFVNFEYSHGHEVEY